MRAEIIGNTLQVEACEDDSHDINFRRINPRIQIYHELAEENSHVENLLLKVPNDFDLARFLVEQPELESSAFPPSLKKIIIRSAPHESEPKVELDSFLLLLSKAPKVEKLILDNLLFTSSSKEACQASLAALRSIHSDTIKACQIRCSLGVARDGYKYVSTQPWSNDFPSALMSSCPQMEQFTNQYHPASYPYGGCMKMNWKSILERPVSCVLRTLSIDVGNDCAGFCDALKNSCPPTLRKLEIAFTCMGPIVAIPEFLANENVANYLEEFAMVLKSLNHRPMSEHVASRPTRPDTFHRRAARAMCYQQLIHENLVEALRDGGKPMLKTFRLSTQEGVSGPYVPYVADGFALALVRAIHANPQLTSVEFPWHFFHSSQVQSVFMHLSVNQQLEHLQRGGNNVHDWIDALRESQYSNDPKYLFYLLIKNPGLFDR